MKCLNLKIRLLIVIFQDPLMANIIVNVINLLYSKMTNVKKVVIKIFYKVLQKILVFNNNIAHLAVV